MAHLVAIITVEQKDLLVGKEFAKDSFFNPIQDLNNNWVISEEEINQCDKAEFSWVKELMPNLIIHEPKVIERT